MNTRSQKYAVNQYHIEVVLAWASFYQGFPVGYLIAWKNPNVRLKDGIGREEGLIDGQQLRLYAIGNQHPHRQQIPKRILC
jgi:hypothetical protein